MAYYHNTPLLLIPRDTDHAKRGHKITPLKSLNTIKTNNFMALKNHHHDGRTFSVNHIPSNSADGANNSPYHPKNQNRSVSTLPDPCLIILT
jgi:hypothetical protein